jgi:hypothetical protein
MSYDLSFWRCISGSELDHEQVYQQLCNGVAVDGLERLPIEALLERVDDVFANWEKLDNVTFDGGERGSFQLFTTPQLFRVDCYGMSGDEMNRLIDIASEFSCPLYDPQVGKRFDKS